MKYFKTLPSILQPDDSGNYITSTNILTRGYLLPSLQNNVYLFYDYTLKDSDSPESISYKFYNDQYRYWMILYANNIFDVFSEWPKTYTNFMLFLNDKYGSLASNNNLTVLEYTNQTIHHYEQKIITTGSNVTDKTTITIEIDSNTYNNFVTTTQTKQFPDGNTVTKQITVQPISIYQYEIDLNESKREIKLIKDVYAIDMEKQLTALMSR